MSMVEAAYRLRKAGLSPIPVAGNDWVMRWVDAETLEPREKSLRKAPAFMNGQGPKLFKWGEFRKRFASDEEIERYFAKVPNVGVAFGNQSGHAECIDFDEPGYYEAWRSLLENHGHEEIVAKLVVQSTQTPGHYQALYRCPDGIEGNKKLAKRPATPEELSIKPDELTKGIIETRGEGGYALVDPSEGYRVVQGSLDSVQIVTGEERAVLWEFARHFDAMPPEPPREAPKRDPGQPAEGTLPGDDFDRRGSWDEVLCPAGWKRGKSHGRLTEWTRPGKDGYAVSAHTGLGHGDVDFLVVFSTNAHPLEPTPMKYGKFRAYCVLNHGGDDSKSQSAGAKVLYAQGFGDRVKPKTSEQRIEDHSPAGSSDQEGATEERHSPDGGFLSHRKRWSELLTLPPKAMLVDKVLGVGDSAMIVGLRKGGKTAVTFDLLFSMLAGTTFAGRFKVLRPLTVAYFTTEGTGAIGVRMQSANLNHEVPDEVLEEALVYVPKLPQTFDEAHEFAIVKVAREMREAGVVPDVMVLDTFAKAILGAEENSNSDVSRALATLQKAREILGCATILLHHIGKGGAIRGASAIDGDLDVLLEVEWDEETTGDRRLVFKFAKDIGGFDPIPFGLEVTEPGKPGAIQVTWSGRRATSSLPSIERAVMAMRQDAEGLWTLAQINALMPDVRSNALQNALNREAQKVNGRVAEIKQGEKAIRYRLTVRGQWA